MRLPGELDASDGAQSASSLVERLVAVRSNLGRQLAASWNVPLGEYLASLIPRARIGPANVHLRLLSRALERYLVARREVGIDDVCELLLARPVIQQSDHANLLLDAETFVNNFLFHIAAARQSLPVAIHSQCTTVSCITRRSPIRGPVFLWTRGRCYRTLPFSNRRLANSSFCALPSPTTFRFLTIDGGVRPHGDALLEALDGGPVTDPSDAYRHANASIWSSLAVSHDVRRVAVDERLSSEAIAMHLEDPTSPIGRLIFDPGVRDVFVRVKRRLVASRVNLTVNRAAPDFFWWREGTELRAIVLEGNGSSARFVLEVNGAAIAALDNATSTSAALRRGDLYGDRILAYLVRCLLPGVVAVGGTVQQDYVELYRRMLIETHRQVPFLDAADILRLQDPNLTRLGGAPLVELDVATKEEISWLGPHTSLTGMAERMLGVPLSRSIGMMRCAWFYDALLDRQARQQSDEAECGA